MARTLATSTMEPWRIGVLTVGSFFLLCGVVLTLGGLVKHCFAAAAATQAGYVPLASDVGSNKRVAPMNCALFIVGTTLAAIGVVMVAVSMAIPSRSTAGQGRSVVTQFVSGYETDFTNANVISDSVDTATAGVSRWTLKYIDASGGAVTVPLVAGLPQVTGDSTSSGQLPLAGSVISGRLRIVHDGRAILLSFTVQRTQSQLVAQLLCPANTKRIALLVLNWSGQSCGRQSKPAPCVPACRTLDEAKSELVKCAKLTLAAVAVCSAVLF